MKMPDSMEALASLAARELEEADRWLNRDGSWDGAERAALALVCSTRAQVFATLALAASAAPAPAPPDAEAAAALLVDTDTLKAISPAAKTRIVEAMGFTRVSEPHARSCPQLVDGGNLCTCVPPSDTYGAPSDVLEFWGQKWQDRVAAKQRKSARKT